MLFPYGTCFGIWRATKTHFDSRNASKLSPVLFGVIPESFRPKARLREEESTIFHFRLRKLEWILSRYGTCFGCRKLPKHILMAKMSRNCLQYYLEWLLKVPGRKRGSKKKKSSISSFHLYRLEWTLFRYGTCFGGVGGYKNTGWWPKHVGIVPSTI